MVEGAKEKIYMDNRIYKKPRKPKYVTNLARELRKASTEAEESLWEVIRGRKLKGLKFRRQTPFGRYILDFYCDEKKLAIEIDGSSHEGKQEYDDNRDKLLKASNVNIIRFTNKDILNDIESVLEQIVCKAFT